MLREFGVDVAAYQSTSLASDHKAGAKFVLIKATEGTGYFNPKAVSQIRSAHEHHMFVHAYHFATFGHSVSRAKQEAKHFISRCHYLNISKKRYLALDWETGDGNYVQGSKAANTKAIIAFMSAVKKAGYKPMLYSGASLLRDNIRTSKVVKKFGTCLWVASYPANGPIWSANFNYFPSMNGVKIWQFTDNWHGLNVDGNVSLNDINVDKNTKKQDKHQKKPASKRKSVVSTSKIVYAPIINNNPRYMISLRDANGHATGKYIPTNSKWRVFAEKMINDKKFYRLGTNKQWVPAKFLKIVKEV